MTDVSLAGVLVRRIAKTLVIAWLNYTIAMHNAVPHMAPMWWFKPDELGQIFKELGWWDEGRSVLVEIKLIELEEKCQIEEVTEQPTIVCLCGSTRFHEAFQQANFEETMKGKIVLSVGFYPHSSAQAHGQEIGITPEQKEDLDRLHFRKIDMADEILVLNVDGYIGESTAREVAYAKRMGKTIRFLEEDNKNDF